MTRFFKHSGGATTQVPTVDPAWLHPDSGVTVWADFAEPTEEEGALLTSVFGFHDLAVQSALRRETHPKIESVRGPSLPGAPRHQFPGRASTCSTRTKRTSSWARTIW